jgi:hypothetical protein
MSKNDICDAHPELMRAAKHVGEPTRRDCPVCGKEKLVLLAYVLLNGLTESSAFGTVANICTLAFAIAVTLPPGWNIYESDRSYQR